MSEADEKVFVTFRGLSNEKEQGLPWMPPLITAYHDEVAQRNAT